MTVTWKEIDENNFAEHFFDARIKQAKPGQILAKYTAIAEFVAGQPKRDIIWLLRADKAKETSQVMRRIHGAKEPWCYSVPRQMAEDMLHGLTDQEIEEKPYKMVIEFLFWTNRECIPPNDPHWETLPVLQIDPETGHYISKIEI